jgi:hypothetical protein
MEIRRYHRYTHVHFFTRQDLWRFLLSRRPAAIFCSIGRA